MTEPITPNDDYTLVSQEGAAWYLRPWYWEPLRLASGPNQPRWPVTEIASLAGMSRRQLGRLLDGQKPLRLVDLKRLSAIVGTDAAKAVIAIEIIGDWSAYDEPVLEILIRMLAPVFRKVDASADFPMEPLSAAAEEKFTTWLADILVTNQKQIRQRRDEFVKLPSL
jgi:transcriptional regulator with XRE-family HTH domain